MTSQLAKSSTIHKYLESGPRICHRSRSPPWRQTAWARKPRKSGNLGHFHGIGIAFVGTERSLRGMTHSAIDRSPWQWDKVRPPLIMTLMEHGYSFNSRRFWIIGNLHDQIMQYAFLLTWFEPIEISWDTAFIKCCGRYKFTSNQGHL